LLLEHIAFSTDEMACLRRTLGPTASARPMAHLGLANITSQIKVHAQEDEGSEVLVY
jgi:hypothetical protein